MKTFIASQNAQIITLVGQANLINATGPSLNLGDQIRQGATVVIADDAQITLALADGTQQVISGIALEQMTEQSMDEASPNPNSTQEPSNDLLAEIADIQALIESGDDVVDLPDTAAGNEAGNEGLGFITINRTGAETLSEARYDTVGPVGANTLAFDQQGSTTSSTLAASGNIAPTTNSTSATGLEDANSIIISLTGSDSDGAVTSFQLTNLPIT